VPHKPGFAFFVTNSACDLHARDVQQVTGETVLRLSHAAALFGTRLASNTNLGNSPQKHLDRPVTDCICGRGHSPNSEPILLATAAWTAKQLIPEKLGSRHAHTKQVSRKRPNQDLGPKATAFSILAFPHNCFMRGDGRMGNFASCCQTKTRVPCDHRNTGDMQAELKRRFGSIATTSHEQTAPEQIPDDNATAAIDDPRNSKAKRK